MQNEPHQSASEAKLNWAYALLSSGFAEMTEALARMDQNTAWGMLATINGRITRTLREESAKLSAKGYPADELKEIADRLSGTIMEAGQALNSERELPQLARLVREAQRENRKVA